MIILNHFEIKESLLCSNPPRVLPISKIHNDIVNTHITTNRM